MLPIDFLALLVFSLLFVTAVFPGWFFDLTGLLWRVTRLSAQQEAHYIGAVFSVWEPIKNGSGKIRIGDSLWSARSSGDVNAGDRVMIVSVSGAVFSVKVIH